MSFNYHLRTMEIWGGYMVVSTVIAAMVACAQHNGNCTADGGETIGIGAAVGFALGGLTALIRTCCDCSESEENDYSTATPILAAASGASYQTATASAALKAN